MVGVVVISHGAMASGMLDSVEMLKGRLERLVALCLYPNDSVDDFSKRLLEAVSTADEGDGVIIFADIHGGTPANRALLLAVEKPELEVVSGINLPILLEVLCEREDGNMESILNTAFAIAPKSFVHSSKQMTASSTRTYDALDDLMK